MVSSPIVEEFHAYSLLPNQPRRQDTKPEPGASKVGCKKERVRVQAVLKSCSCALADDRIKFSDPTEYLWRLQVLRDITLDCWRILPFEGDFVNMFDEILSRLLELEYALPDSN